MIDFEKILVPSGDGIFSLSNANEVKRIFQEKRYKDKIQEHKSDIEKMGHSLTLVSLPSDSGGGIHRGANWGPLRIKLSLLDSETEYLDIGDIPVIPHLLHDKYLNKETILAVRKELKLDDEAPVSPLSIGEKFAKLYFDNIDAPLFILGGDHSTSYPFAMSAVEKFDDIAVIHFDAHPDLLSSRQGIDLNFSSWAHHVAKKLNNPKKFIQIGIRATGKTKDQWEKENKVKQYWACNIPPCHKIIETLKQENIKKLYISVDVDVLDKKFVAATGTPEGEGLAPHHVTSIISGLSKEFKIIATDLVEYAPFINYTGESVTLTNSALTVSSLCKKLMELTANSWQ